MMNWLQYYIFLGEFAEAVKAGDYELVKRAFRGEGKYDLECPDVRGKTLLMMAAEKGLLHSLIYILLSPKRFL